LGKRYKNFTAAEWYTAGYPYAELFLHKE